MRSSGRLVMMAVAALLLGPALGCAVAQPSAASVEAGRGDWRETSRHYQRLLERRERETPTATPRPLPPLPSLRTEAMEPLTPEDDGWERAQLSLEEALTELVEADARQRVTPPQSGSESNLLEARRLYTAGFAKLTAGDNAGAAKDFSRAAQLDPGASAPWLRLAEAQARSGQGPASLLSRQRAADLGSDDPVSLYILGAQTARLGQDEQAARYLARTLGAKPGRIDPLLPAVAKARIAGPLERLGYLRASLEAMREALEAEAQIGARRSLFAGDAREVLQSGRGMWIRIGDLASRLGDAEAARAAYAEAGADSGADPQALFARRALALLARGQHAAVALLVLDDLAEREGLADQRHVDLVRALPRDAQVRDALAGALADLAEARAGGSRTVAESLTLARAAALPDAEARRLLAERARAHPGEAAVLDALLRTFTDEAARLDTVLDLARETPSAAESLAGALARWTDRPAAVAEGLPDSPVGRLIRAHLIIRFGRAEKVELPESLWQTTALAEAAGLAAALSGDWQLVDRTLEALRDEPLGAARVSRMAQRFAAGLDRLSPLLDREPANVEARLLAAELALAAGREDRAADVLEEALAADPFDERVYEALIAVSQAQGNSERVGEVSRELRRRVPRARLLRWAEIEEAVQRGDLDAAESVLRSLASENPERVDAVETLVQIWSQRARLGGAADLTDASNWIRRRAQRFPKAAALEAARGRLLAIAGSPQQAETQLREAMESRPSVALSRALESVLRESNRAEEADHVALQRYQLAGVGIEASLDHAEALVRSGALDHLPSVLARAMPEGATLTTRQQSRLVTLLGALVGSAEALGTEPARQRVLVVLDAAVERGLELPWQTLWARWALLADDPDVSDEKILDATELVVGAVESMEAARRFTSGAVMSDPVPIRTIEEGRGSVAYLLANSLYNSGREDAAIEAFRLALEHYPEHAWAANDLGYFLVERHENLEEAERLLELAYRLKPGQASIADSLGWLRYKLGRFDDRTLEDGTVEPGAVSLLSTAAGLPGGRENATIHDHLGDALWRAGDSERALANWIRAQQLLFDQLVRLRDGGSSPARLRLTEQASLVGAKVDAVRAGEEPSPAPTFEDN